MMELTEYLWKEDLDEEDMVEMVSRMILFFYKEMEDRKYLRINLRIVDYQQSWHEDD